MKALNCCSNDIDFILVISFSFHFTHKLVHSFMICCRAFCWKFINNAGKSSTKENIYEWKELKDFRNEYLCTKALLSERRASWGELSKAFLGVEACAVFETRKQIDYMLFIVGLNNKAWSDREGRKIQSAWEKLLIASVGGSNMLFSKYIKWPVEFLVTAIRQ